MIIRKLDTFERYQVEDKADGAHAFSVGFVRKFDLIGSPESSNNQMKRESAALFFVDANSYLAQIIVELISQRRIDLKSKKMNNDFLLKDEKIIKESNSGLFLTNKRVVYKTDNIYQSIRLNKISALKCESTWSFSGKAFAIIILVLVAIYVYLSYSNNEISIFPGLIVIVISYFLCLKGNHFIAIYSCGTMCIQEKISRKNKKDFIEFLKSVDEAIEKNNKNGRMNDYQPLSSEWPYNH